MKNYVMSGNTLPLTAPANVVSGQGVLIGSIFGVAKANAASGQPVELVTTGVFTMPRATGASTAWAVGDRLYWDNGAGVVTKNAASGANKLIGAAVAVTADGDATGRVTLTGAFTL